MRTIETEGAIRDPSTIENVHRVKITETCSVLVWETLFSREELETLKKELLDTIRGSGVADVTKMWGKTFDNKGRRVLEMAEKPGFKYHYAGKTVTGIEFSPCVQTIVVPKMAEIFGVHASKIWGHLVFYPTSECKLDWHDDGEDGINPHMIASITFLEFPQKGARPFQVRAKADFPSGFGGRKSKTSAAKKGTKRSGATVEDVKDAKREDKKIKL